MAVHQSIAEGLSWIFRGIEALKAAFPDRKFTIDGRLVGDIGEIIANLEYDLILDGISRPSYDAKTVDGRDMQIKATFKDQLTFKTANGLYLGFKLDPRGDYEEVFNGPADLIFRHFAKRKNIGSS
jgi:hypothetical protein